MIRYEGFKGFFIMKKDPNGDWEYLSFYRNGRGGAKMLFSNDRARYFTDNSIMNGTAWTAMNAVIRAYPQSKVVLYVDIDHSTIRVKYYNPTGEKKITVWHRNEDFYPYAPQKEIR